jgi:hypothetical protein
MEGREKWQASGIVSGCNKVRNSKDVSKENEVKFSRIH